MWYVAGYDYNTNGFPYPIVKYWKNGTEVSLTAGTPYNYGLGHSMYVSGSDVYVAGYSANQSLASFAACYWKNGNQVTLSDSTTSIAEARSIFVAGNDVYVGGQVHPDLALVVCKSLTYWKNGQAFSLTNGPAWLVFFLFILTEATCMQQATRKIMQPAGRLRDTGKTELLLHYRALTYIIVPSQFMYSGMMCMLWFGERWLL
jgi:hypothetical protein